MSNTRRTEIRHISSADLGKIAQLLNQTFACKKLMQTVPLELTHPEDLNEGKQKYNFDHMKLVENASFKLNKAPAQIFLEEWVTTAADYVAVNLLNEEPPERPSKGPAAKIDIALPEDDEVDLNERISQMNYPNSSQIINLNNGQIPIKEFHNKQIFNRTLIANNPISEVDLITSSAAKSASENVQFQENNHTVIQSHRSTTTLNRDTQQPEHTDINISIPREISGNSIVAPNISSIRTDSTNNPLESNYEMNESTYYLTSTGSSLTSYPVMYPKTSLLNANYSRHFRISQRFIAECTAF